MPTPTADQSEGGSPQVGGEGGAEHMDGPGGQSFARALFSRWGWVAFGLLAGLTASTYYLSKTPKIYTASTTILEAAHGVSLLNAVAAMNTHVERIGRPELLERVASRIDVRNLDGLVPEPVDWMPGFMQKWLPASDDGNEINDTDHPPPEVLAGMIKGWLEVKWRPHTRLIDVEVSHPVPEVAKAIADAIPREFINDSAADRFIARSNVLEFLNREAENVRESLLASQQALAVYRRVIEHHAHLEEAETRLRMAGHRHAPDHPTVLSSTREVEFWRGRFLDEYQAAQTIPGEEAHWKHEDETTDDALSPEREVVLAYGKLSARIAVLQSEIDSITSVFHSLLARMAEFKELNDLPAAEMSISSFASVPERAARPIPRRVFLKGSGYGLAAGMGLTLLFALRSYLSPRKVPEQPEAVPVAKAESKEG